MLIAYTIQFKYLFNQSNSLVLSDDLTINSNTTLRSQITNFLNEEEEKLKEEESIMETLAEFQNSNNEQKIMGNNDKENDRNNDAPTPKIDEKINENVTEEESDLKSMKENSLSKNESSTTLISRCSESQE